MLRGDHFPVAFDQEREKIGPCVADRGKRHPVPELTWIEEWSAERVRTTLADVVPELDLQRLVLEPVLDRGIPRWSTGCAVIDGAYIAKFALSEPTAARLWHASMRSAARSRASWRCCTTRAPSS
jgi:hypothetical protein